MKRFWFACTSVLDGSEVWINSQYVMKVDMVAMGTRILLVNGGICIVKEPMHEILEMITGVNPKL